MAPGPLTSYADPLVLGRRNRSPRVVSLRLGSKQAVLNQPLHSAATQPPRDSPMQPFALLVLIIPGAEEMKRPRSGSAHDRLVCSFRS